MRVTPEALKHELASLHEQRPQLVVLVPVLATLHHSEKRSLPCVLTHQFSLSYPAVCVRSPARRPSPRGRRSYAYDRTPNHPKV